MRITLLVAPSRSRSGLLADVASLLRRAGAHVEMAVPVNGERLPAADLFVHKYRSGPGMTAGAALHASGARLVNPYPVTALLADKGRTCQLLAAAGLPVPETIVRPQRGQIVELLRGGPVVIKPVYGSRGRGVRVVRSPRELTCDLADEAVLVQRYHVPDGRDRKLYRIGDDVFCVERPWPSLPTPDRGGRNVPVDDDLRHVLVRCGEVIGTDLYGVDVVLSRGRPWVVDASSFPGFKGVPGAAARLAAYALAAASNGGGKPCAH
jgi:ribosomal protein S6--L-glutamate ligase